MSHDFIFIHRYKKIYEFIYKVLDGFYLYLQLKQYFRLLGWIGIYKLI